MRERTIWRVLVTYCRQENAVYAAVSDPESARKLKALAVSLGYRDARIQSVEIEDRRPPEEVKEDPGEAAWIADEDETPPQVLDRQSRKVRDLQRKSRSTA